MASVIYIDGNDLRARELQRFAPDFAFTTAPLQTGFSTSAPAPEKRASDKLLAAGVVGFAEAVDILTTDGKSLRLDLDSENDNRFCRHWRETPCQMVLCIAVLPAPGQPTAIIRVVCDGKIADKPMGPSQLGWDRLFYPAEHRRTLAELCDAAQLPAFRQQAYRQLVALFRPGMPTSA